jgi:hypothetical protein
MTRGRKTDKSLLTSLSRKGEKITEGTLIWESQLLYWIPDQVVHLLRIATILYSELLRKVPPTAVYGSISGYDLRGMTNGFRPSRNDKRNDKRSQGLRREMPE